MKAWFRHLEVRLTSKLLNKSLVFGRNYLEDKDDLYIDAKVFKYVSTLKDEALVKIKNLTIAEVVQIMQGQYYDIDIICGYRSDNIMNIFSGSVLYVSNETDGRSNTVIVLCSNKFIAQYGQTRMNLSLSSGINLFSAIKYICQKANIPNTNVSEELKTSFLQNIETVSTSTAAYLDSLTQNNDSLIISADNSNGSTLTIFDAVKRNNRVIELNDSTIILQTYPQLTEQGFILNAMPTFNFMPGDVIKIDNSILQIPVTDKSQLSKNYGYYLDKDGCYMVFEVKYNLQNRGSQFSLQLLCKSRSLVSNLGK